MILVNEKVEHISFGVGVVTEERDNKIWVQFQDGIEKKAFLYPDAFEKFLKAANPEIENNVLNELQRRQEELEHMRLEEMLKEAELRENSIKPSNVKKRASRTVKAKV